MIKLANLLSDTYRSLNYWWLIAWKPQNRSYLPINLPLSHPEKSVLSKGLNFVRISEKPTNFQIARR